MQKREETKTKQNSAGSAIILGVVLCMLYSNWASDEQNNAAKDTEEEKIQFCACCMDEMP